MNPANDPFVKQMMSAASYISRAKLLTESEGTKNILSACNTLITLALRLHEDQANARINGE